MFLKIKVNAEGNKVNINLPLAIVKICIDSGLEIPQVTVSNQRIYWVCFVFSNSMFAFCAVAEKASISANANNMLFFICVSFINNFLQS